MRCPACQSPALEDAACRQCGFSLESADQHFGIAPVLERPVTDLSLSLSQGDRAKIAAAAREFERHFPQVSIAIVLSTVPDGVPPATWAFWLFNRGSLFSAVEKGGQNHGVLLFIDTAHQQALLILGYGLEPFIAEAPLQAFLEESNQHLAKGRSATAILNCLTRLEHEFTEVCDSLPKLFGYAEGSDWIDATVGTDPPSQPNRTQDDLF